MDSKTKTSNKKRNLILSIISVFCLIIIILNIRSWFNAYIERVVILSVIYAICAMSMNLVNGFTGLFTLGQPGFMAIGAYVYALLSLTPQAKAAQFYIKPIVPFLGNVQLNPWIAMIVGGFAAAVAAFLIGFPVLRLKGDYLAIASLGFAEIIRLLITNGQSITNGPSGLKTIPSILTIELSFLILAVFAVLLLSLVRSSYGRAYKAIREDEIAASSVGVYLFKFKMQAFIISGFMAGVGGAMLASVLGTIDPNQFRFTLVYMLLLMVILGGQGSLSVTDRDVFHALFGSEKALDDRNAM
jgi:branched-chain amino acid transport system permease protein